MGVVGREGEVNIIPGGERGLVICVERRRK
nr:MAG TPA: hypothetical protein [Caudoviricetes sp.]